MALELTEQQLLLRDSMSKFLSARYGPEARREVLTGELGWSPEIWRALAEELGVLGASFPEELGGLGGGPVDVLVLMEELGRALLLEPFLETVVLGGGLLKRSGTPLAREVITKVIAGEARLAFAYCEPQARYAWNDVQTQAERRGADFVLNGRKAVVSGAPSSTHLLVSARTSGGRLERAGVTVFIVDPRASGVSMRPYRTIDGRLAAEVSFENVSVSAEAALSQPDAAGDMIEAALDEAAAAACAEAAGVLERLVSGTVAYTKERRQFGVPIASFQALQHRMVDMFIQAQQASSMSHMAAAQLTKPPEVRARAVSAAKAFVGDACRVVGQSAIQLHGAMGITDELPISHYFKRALAIENQYGSTDYHLARYQQLTSLH